MCSLATSCRRTPISPRSKKPSSSSSALTSRSIESSSVSASMGAHSSSLTRRARVQAVRSPVRRRGDVRCLHAIRDLPNLTRFPSACTASDGTLSFSEIQNIIQSTSISSKQVFDKDAQVKYLIYDDASQSSALREPKLTFQSIIDKLGLLRRR